MASYAGPSVAYLVAHAGEWQGADSSFAGRYVTKHQIAKARKLVREQRADYHAARADWYANRQLGWKSWRRGRLYGPMMAWWGDSHESECRAGIAMEQREWLRRYEKELSALLALRDIVERRLAT